MSKDPRNEQENDGWKLKKINDRNSYLLGLFNCGDDDLNEYFQKDALLHKEQLISQTYYFKAAGEPDFPVALIDFCNDSIRLKKFISPPNIPDGKRYPFLPAVKITRLGVYHKVQGYGVGSHLINIVKRLFITKNRTGCRFLTVDAYNNQRAIKFYQSNGFQFFSNKDEGKQTRSMFFDLKRIVK